MAIYHCSMKPISRSSGRSAVAAAAYRSAQSLVNERDGQTHDFTRRDGVEHCEIVLPAGVDAAWALDRSQLWNAAERAENRCDARVAREFEIALPHELSAEQRLALTRSFAVDLANRHGAAVDFAIHSPHGATDVRNHHAHLMMTTRTVSADGLGEKTPIEWKNARLLSENLPTSQMQLRDIRQAFEHHANEHLARAGHEARIDHRSHQERGLELLPTQHMGVHATQMDRRGKEISRLRIDEDAARHNRDLIREKPEQVLALVTNERSVFDRHDVARTLHRYIQDPQEFQNAFAGVMQSPALIELRGDVKNGRGEVSELARYSTREMMAIEQGMIESATRLQEITPRDTSYRHLITGYGQLFNVSEPHIDTALEARPYLAEEQCEAVRHVTDGKGIAAVVGLAGAGKSTMLAAAREAWEANGMRVYGAALAGKAAEGLEEASGIQSRTLASFEMSWQNDRHRLQRGDVLVIDEAGMVSSKQMARFVSECERSEAKLVLVGDPQQLQPINAGAAFRAITERIGFAQLEEVRRQNEPWQREASVDLARHRTTKVLADYEFMGAVRFNDSRDAARTAIVADVMADRRAHPDDSRLVLTYRRADVRELNEAIRGERVAGGELQEGVAFQTNDGERKFAEGDRILFLENNRELGVKNGMLGTVEAVEPERLNIRLDGQRAASRGPFQERNQDRRTIELDAARYTAFDHGYATTIHKSQGATVDRSFVLASPGMDSHLTYVAMTRHREGVRLYAGRDDFADSKALSAELSRFNGKETTLDYAERRGIDAGAEHHLLANIAVPMHERQAEQVAQRQDQAQARPAAELTTAERLARWHEEVDQEHRNGRTPNELRHDRQGPAMRGQDTQAFDHRGERSPTESEDERIARLRALFAEDRRRQEPDEQRFARLREAFAEDRRRPEEPTEERTARLRASMAEFQQSQIPDPQRIERLRASFAERPEPETAEARQERLQALFAKSDGRTAEAEPKQSTAERLAELHERENTPKTQSRAADRENGRERDRGHEQDDYGR